MVFSTMALTAEELHEIQECEKIVRFRDAVLSGTHPRIKVPAHLLGKLSNATRHGSTPNSVTPRPNLPAAPQIEAASKSPSINANEENALYNSKASNVQQVLTGKPSALISKMPKAVKSGINPVLLEKSDDLIKAEIQLQRQRLERVLREQIEQRRISMKASLQTLESLPDFDISEVLSKALTIVHPSMANEAEQAVGDQASAASDSFDENTFYSSQHDTPEQSITSQEHHEPAQARLEDVAVTIAVSDAGPIENGPTMTHDKSRDIVMADISLPSVNSGDQDATLDQPLLRQFSQNSSYSNPLGLNVTTTDMAQLPQEGTYKMGVTDASSSKPQTAPDVAISIQSEEMSGLSSKTPDELADLSTVQTGALLKRKFCEPKSTESAQSVEPAIIRTRDDLSPIAPQPARVSPLATARAPIVEQSIIAGGALVAPVATLRKPSDLSSRDSSPKGAKPSKIRKLRMSKKSNAKQVAADNTPDSTYIKPEPQSPSPFSTIPLPRPHKRQRQTFQQGPELNYDEPRYEVSREEPRDPHSQIEPIRYRERMSRPIYDIAEDERMYESRDTELSGYRRVAGDENQYRRITSQESYKVPRSPLMYTHPSQPRPVRATSHSIVERHVQDQQRYRRDQNPPTRAAIRLDGDDERSRSPIIVRDRRSPVLMAPPPRVASTRIIVDEYGRQYYAPPPAPISRQSVAPAIRPGGEEIVYERYPPPSSFSRQSVVPATRPDEDDLVYERFPPVRAPISSRQSVAPTNRSGEEDVYERYAPVRLPLPSRQSVARPSRSREDDIIYERYAPATTIIPLQQSVTASVRPGDDDLIYERTVRRPLAGPAAEIYEEDGILYRRSPPPCPPRRIVSQTDLETDYRAYRQREYSVRPVAMAPPSDEYVRVREPVERRQMSVRPSEAELIRREYMPAPEGYVAARPIGRRVADRTEYTERAQEVSYDTYADDVRREVVHR